MRKNRFFQVVVTLLLIGVIAQPLMSQEPYRFGTTTANFLEIGYGSAGLAMGDAYVAMANDISSIYWNPAGLAFMEQSEAQFLKQPWIADINTSFTGVGLVLPNVGTLALGIFQTGYGETDVTTLDMQDGTGEKFSANDIAFTFSYARRLATWFAFGASGKYVSSQIWHTSASAIAVDLGVNINTAFFSPTGERDDGMNIGMSISNFGTRMQFEGNDLTFPIDIAPNEDGNFRDTKGEFQTEEYELPLIFRLGISINPFVVGNNKITLAADALHPNNASESINLGGQYTLTIPQTGEFYVRGGYKGIYLDESIFGGTYGGGMILHFMNNMSVKVDYAYRDMDILGNFHAYSLGVMF